jgi:hypothetical protein
VAAVVVAEARAQALQGAPSVVQLAGGALQQEEVPLRVAGQQGAL